jgi:release factor glutamine methyltransferase
VWTTTRNDLSGWLDAARQALAAVSDQPSLEAQALLGGELGKSRAWIFAHSEDVLTQVDLHQLDQWINRRLNGEPLPYILGRWEFYGLDFIVSPDVLIPRPETEQLVDLGREWIKKHPGLQKMVDVGTGSGCIAASLAYWSPDLVVYACDRSLPALRIAATNFQSLGLANRILPVASDLLTALRGPFDLICANLPYIPSETLEDLEVARFEPRLALDGGKDGLRLIEPLLDQARQRLSPGGQILLEIEFSQDRSALETARRYFPHARIELKMDLSGLPRNVIIEP